jgi:hypothetical protein
VIIVRTWHERVMRSDVPDSHLTVCRICAGAAVEGLARLGGVEVWQSQGKGQGSGEFQFHGLCGILAQVS